MANPNTPNTPEIPEQAQQELNPGNEQIQHSLAAVLQNPRGKLTPADFKWPQNQEIRTAFKKFFLENDIPFSSSFNAARRTEILKNGPESERPSAIIALILHVDSEQLKTPETQNLETQNPETQKILERLKSMPQDS